MIPKRNLFVAVRKAIKQPGYAMKAFKQRARSFLDYHWKDGFSSYPETISLFLTYRCNLQCTMCGQWGVEGSSRELTPEALKSELTLEQLQSVIDDIKFHKPNITLFGGEPLLYKEWANLVRYIKEAGLRCNIITNGMLLGKYAEDIVALGVDEIIFSLDGPREIHDKIRGAVGIFDKAYKGLKAVNTWKEKKSCLTPLINISSTIFETNYQQMDKIVDVAEDLLASSITFHHLIFLNHQTYECHNDLFQSLFNVTCRDWRGFVRKTLPDIHVEQLIDAIHRVKRRVSRTHIYFYPNLTDEEIRQYYTNFDFKPSSYKHRCISPWMVAYIFPDGTVRPCQSLNYMAGNVKEDSFKNIWNNQKYLKFRSTTKKNKLYPVCYRCTELYRF
ncbi:MAG: radical SAM protein [Planctomycetota bacterium]|nr:radical SAM protein [Planctomycetota bacterium]MDE1889750.1 radical SAM protein [Planctomycetota bacterium]MDE2217275.1 radical SAM protein [Planctomycetota bacterium]